MVPCLGNENHSPADVRGFQWWSMLSGCTAGYWFGNRDTWPFADPAGGYDAPLFAPHGQGTDAAGATGGSAAAQATDGSLLVAYTPSTSFSVDLRSMTSGQIRARWWDPTNGTFSAIGTTDNSQSAYSVTTPGANVAGDNDWLLVLDAAAPGGVTVSPSSTSVPPKGTTTFTASGGSGTGYVWSLSANPSGGSLALAWIPRRRTWRRSPSRTGV